MASLEVYVFDVYRNQQPIKNGKLTLSGRSNTVLRITGRDVDQELMEPLVLANDKAYWNDRAIFVKRTDVEIGTSRERWLLLSWGSKLPYGSGDYSCMLQLDLSRVCADKWEDLW